jgi:hypothetical protein
MIFDSFVRSVNRSILIDPWISPNKESKDRDTGMLTFSET